MWFDLAFGIRRRHCCRQNDQMDMSVRCNAKQKMANGIRDGNNTRTYCTQINVAAPACSIRIRQSSIRYSRLKTTRPYEYKTLFDMRRCKLENRKHTCGAVRREHSLWDATPRTVGTCTKPSLQWAEEFILNGIFKGLLKISCFSKLVSTISKNTCTFAEAFF